MVTDFLSRRLRQHYRRRLTIKYPDHRQLFAPEPEHEIICLDTETSSLNPKSACLISIGALMIRNHRIIFGEKLDLRIRPRSPLKADSIKIHQLRNQDLEQALPLEEALEELIQFIGSRPILGYWIQFDMALINRLMKAHYPFKLPNRTLELSDIYRRKAERMNAWHPPDLRFESMADALKIDPIERHSALGDALTTALMYLKLTKDHFTSPLVL